MRAALVGHDAPPDVHPLPPTPALPTLSVGKLSAEGTVGGLKLDVVDSESISNFLSSAEDTYGPIDVVVNNAGVESGAKTYVMVEEEDWDWVMNTNLKGSWMVSKAYTQQLIANGHKGGNIINISSKHHSN